LAVKVSYGKNKNDYIVLVSSYFKFSTPTTAHIESLEQILAKESSRTVICADTNGHSKRWYSTKQNRLGRITERLIDKYDLVVHNKPGHLNTFYRQDGRSSNIDVTLTTPDIKNLINEWTVTNETDSDHRVISFYIRVKNPPKRDQPSPRYNVQSADWDKFKTSLLGETGRITEVCVNSMARDISRAIITAADMSMNKKKPSGPTGKCPWWSPLLTTLRKNLIRQRRNGLRTTNRPAYNKLRNDFLSETRKHKSAAWKHSQYQPME